MIIAFKKGENRQITSHFNSKEFECPCSSCNLDTQYISEDLVTKLEEVRIEYGSGIIINSGYRCPLHNKAVGGKENSSHMNGLAADPSPVRKTLDDLDNLYDICYYKFDNVGDGRNRGFIHVDVREKKATGKRHWIY